MAETTNEPTVHELFDLTGRTAIITGSTGHLGSSMARALAEAGGRVICTSRVEANAVEVASRLPDPCGVKHVGLALDQMDSGSIDEFFGRAVAAAKSVDILVNNGHEAIPGDWSTVTGDEFNRQLANVTGYFLLARLLRDHAVKRNAAASVILLGSMYGLVASYPDAYEGLCPASPAAYHALKGGIVQLTRHLAAYWAKDRVRVNCLSPGPFPAPGVAPELVERLETKLPLHRIGQPYELKGALLLLASDAGSYLTGHNLVVDGGWTAW